jgi:predicted Co/Zn/Cd cation transporter (cation efflux family)
MFRSQLPSPQRPWLRRLTGIQWLMVAVVLIVVFLAFVVAWVAAGYAFHLDTTAWNARLVVIALLAQFLVLIRLARRRRLSARLIATPATLGKGQRSRRRRALPPYRHRRFAEIGDARNRRAPAGR